MVKHIQTIRQQIADELFECVWLFCEIGAKRVKSLSALEQSQNSFMGSIQKKKVK